MEAGEAFPVFQTSDVGYMVGCTTDVYGAGNTDFWLIKTDASGNMEWNQTFGGPGWELFSAMCHTDDGGYVLFGSILFSEALLVKIDAQGNTVWEKTYDDHRAGCIIQIPGAGFLAAGGGWVFAIDALGNLLWNRTYEPPFFSFGFRGFTSAIQTIDGGYALVGYFGQGDGVIPYLVTAGYEFGITWTDSTANTLTLYRGSTDSYWNYVHIRVWKIKEAP